MTMKVMKMAMDPDISLKSIANEMSTDVALATRILKSRQFQFLYSF
jgi:HD-like signal output (HDOD) protein